MCPVDLEAAGPSGRTAEASQAAGTQPGSRTNKSSKSRIASPADSDEAESEVSVLLSSRREALQKTIDADTSLIVACPRDVK